MARLPPRYLERSKAPFVEGLWQVGGTGWQSVQSPSGTEEWDSGEWDAFNEDHNIDDIYKIATLAKCFGLTSLGHMKKQ